VAGLTWFGHLGRAVFATMTLTFLALAVVVLVNGLAAHPQPQTTSAPATTSPAAAVVLAFPVAMAMATGVEAPESTIAQRDNSTTPAGGGSDSITLWLALGIVGVIMLGLTAEALHLRIGVPGPDSTEIAELGPLRHPRAVVRRLPARHNAVAAVGGEFVIPGRAGPAQGARRRTRSGRAVAGDRACRVRPHQQPLHPQLGGVLVFVVGSAALATAAGGNDQRLVLFYAVAVFLSFLAGMLAMTRLYAPDSQRRWP
jgi:hypothetical protein